MKNEKSVKTTSEKALHRFAAAASVLLAVCLVFMMPVSAETHTDHTDWTELTSSTTTPLASGKYYLNNDLELDSSLTIAENAQVTLCLNGKMLKATEGKTISIITVSKGAVLNLTDCSENKAGKITGGKGTDIVPSYGQTVGGGIYVNEGTLNMYGGNITTCNSAVGGGVFVQNGSFNMYGGDITLCTSTAGGGIAIISSTLTMSGGSIVECSSASGGGVYLMDSSFEMSDGKISDCSSTEHGGGVSIVEGTGTSSFTISNNAVIDGCTATKGGGGVSLSSGSVTMSGGKIANCESTTGNGGGIVIPYMKDATTEFTMTGGEISDCTAKTTGGGVSISSGTFTMSGGKIAKCTDKDNENGGGGISTSVELSVSGNAEIEGVDINSATTITIPEGQTFSGTISGINSVQSNKESIKVEGTLGEDAKITGSSDDSSEEGDGTVSLIEFTVTWKNSDGSVLEIDTGVRYGTTPAYNGATPTKASNETHSFTFAGWTPEVTASVTKNAEYTATFTAVEIPPAPSSLSSSSKGSDSGNYQYFPREVTADGIISFGSSKVVKGMELPAGSSGRVTLNTMPDFEMPENGFYAFEIDAPGYNLDAKINGGLSFQIKAADLEAEGWTAEDIVLYHGTVAEDGTITWEALPTSLVEVENGIAYYKAVINGCSPFYIGFVEDGSIVNEPVVEPSDEPTDVPQDVPGEDLPDIPGVQDEPEEPSTPAPILAVLAGLGAAVVLRRK